jgi:ATP-dependent Clp protease protease subunit
VKDSILNAYVKKTGLSKNKLSKLMDDETWMDASKAVELHFADRVMERPDLYRSEQEEKPEEDDPAKENPEESEEKTEQAPDGPKKNKDLLAAGFLYSSRQMAAAFTNKVKEHYKVRNKASEAPIAKDTADKGRSVDALMDRLNLLHTMM